MRKSNTDEACCVTRHGHVRPQRVLRLLRPSIGVEKFATGKVPGVASQHWCDSTSWVDDKVVWSKLQATLTRRGQKPPGNALTRDCACRGYVAGSVTTSARRPQSVDRFHPRPRRTPLDRHAVSSRKPSYR